MKAKSRVFILLGALLSVVIPQNNNQLKTNVKTIEGANLMSAEEKATEWDLAKDEDGIKVYTREVAGYQMKEFKGVIQIKSSLESLVALYDDTDSWPEWRDNITKVLKEVSPTEKYIYYYSRAPWPVSDRDNIIHSVLTQDSNTKEVVITEMAVPDYIPENSCCVRIPEEKNYWEFTPLGNGVVEVTWQNHTNPGGRLPTFLVNSGVVDIPYDTFSKMKEIVQQRKYQQVKLTFLK